MFPGESSLFVGASRSGLHFARFRTPVSFSAAPYHIPLFTCSLIHFPEVAGVFGDRIASLWTSASTYKYFEIIFSY